MHISDFSGTTLRLRYQLVRRIGYGGMATVYEATDLQIDKRVAVKVLNPQFSHIEDYIARFRQEALSAARIRHPQLVDVTDFGSDDGLVYFVMELLEGESLGERIHREAGPIPWPEVVVIVCQVCEALACAHQHGIIHRDVKPGNVFLVDQPGRSGVATVKLLDLGVAKVLRDALDLRDAAAPETRLSQGTPGTPEYMAPEQATGQPIDHRIDVYALGVMMYRMLTGNLPFFSPKSSFEVLRMHVDLAPVSLRQLCPEAEIPEAMEAIVLKALAKRPVDRFESVRALAAALQSQSVLPRDIPISIAPARSRDDMTTHYYHPTSPLPGLFLLKPAAMLLTLVTSGVLAMFLMLFDLPGIKAIASAGAGRQEVPRQPPRSSPIVLKGDDPAHVTIPGGEPETGTPGGPATTASTPPVTPVPNTPTQVGPTPPVLTPPVPSPPVMTPPGIIPPAKVDTKRTPPVPTPPPPPPPKGPKALAEQSIRTAAKKIGKQCNMGRAAIVSVRVVANLANNSVEPTLTGPQSTAAGCVSTALRAVKPLKKPAEGLLVLNLNIAVGAAR